MLPRRRAVPRATSQQVVGGTLQGERLLTVIDRGEKETVTRRSCWLTSPKKALLGIMKIAGFLTVQTTTSSYFCRG